MIGWMEARCCATLDRWGAQRWQSQLTQAAKMAQTSAIVLFGRAEKQEIWVVI